MFKPLERDGKFLGFAMDRDDRFYFFGSNLVTRADLPVLFPKYEFCFLKQVHGRAVVEADPKSSHEGDAHYTAVPKRALTVQSADCLPILLSSESQICAIHAGWRGVAMDIVSTVGNVLPRFKPDVAAIGPHITSASFEVGADVAQALECATPVGISASQFSKPQANGKILFDLKSLVSAQLTSAFGANIDVQEAISDTKSDLRFHSFRRDCSKAERQYSFVVIKD